MAINATYATYELRCQGVESNETRRGTSMSIREGEGDKTHLKSSRGVRQTTEEGLTKS